MNVNGKSIYNELLLTCKSPSAIFSGIASLIVLIFGPIYFFPKDADVHTLMACCIGLSSIALLEPGFKSEWREISFGFGISGRDWWLSRLRKIACTSLILGSVLLLTELGYRGMTGVWFISQMPFLAIAVHAIAYLAFVMVEERWMKSRANIIPMASMFSILGLYHILKGTGGFAAFFSNPIVILSTCSAALVFGLLFYVDARRS